MGKKTVMVIDDDREFLEEISDMLASNGYLVETAEDGNTAVERVKQLHPDIILLDIQLKKVNGPAVFDGLTVFDELKKMEHVSAIPVIAISGVYVKSYQSNYFLVHGVDSFIAKPFSVQKLLEEIEKKLCNTGAKKKK